MGLYKCGDVVYFIEAKDMRSASIGVIIGICGEEYTILEFSYTNTIYKVSKGEIRPLSDKENILKGINKYYENQINELKSKIKSVNRIDYASEIVNKYEQLKTEIKNTAKHIVYAEDDFDFENKLKAICQKKKQLFAIECEGISDARKYNGAIKYEIKELERDRNRVIYNLNSNTERLEKNLNS